ncbi:MAG: sulfite exporter TauE/SafE family protein [Acidobacteria bacterium]|jgi:hypothetical protein|nr:sulfite exporter TauE/SafE family protein [Acidobacteriota bacterium]
MNGFLYLPIAEVSVNVFLLLGMGLTIGFLSGLFGVGGGFLLTPALMMMGIPPTIAAASDSNQIVAATTSATYAHWRLGNVDVKMGLLLLCGGLCGGGLGVEIIKLLRQVGNADFLIKICYVVTLSIVGFYMFQESLGNLRRPPMGVSTPDQEPARPASRLLLALPWQVHFARSRVTMSLLLPVMIGFLVGMLAAIMGIGGGFIMVPALVYILRMPMHVVIGTNLFQEIFLCMSITFMQAEVNHTVDFVLALILLVGSTLGAQLGARVSRRLKADQLKFLLACIILLTMLDIAVDLLATPDVLLSLKATV